jgi:hypothetical protein
MALGALGAAACHVGRQQASLAAFLLRDPCLRHIVVVVWMVTFGGNMQSPVIPFFYLEIGMDAVEIGNTGFIIMASLLVSGLSSCCFCLRLAPARAAPLTR